MARPQQQMRRDVLMWGTGLVLAAVATVIASVSGARLGAALTGGVIVLVVVVVVGLAVEARQR